MVDIINVKNIEDRARKIDALVADFICVHTGTDLQPTGKNSLAELKRLMKKLEIDTNQMFARHTNLE